jgi:hypothetical protein
MIARLAGSTIVGLCLAWCWKVEAVEAHGSPVMLDGGSGALIATGGLGLSSGYASMAFDASEEAGLDFPAATVRTDLPGVDVTGIAGGEPLEIEILARPDHSTAGTPRRWLWYWDGSAEAVAVAADDPDFFFRRKDLMGSLTIDQFTAPSTNRLTMIDSLTPDSHLHALRYELDNVPAAAFGVYGVFARFLIPGRDPSPPLLLAFGYGVTGEQYAAGATAINAAAGFAGDYNTDGVVDGADLLAWQATLGTSGLPGGYPPADGSLNGLVDAADLGVWRADFGRSVATTPALSALPEPTTGLLLASLLTIAISAQRAPNERGGASAE